MNNAISSRQTVLLVFIAVTTTYSIIDMPKFMAQSFGRSSWVPILIGAAFFAAAVFLITRLGSMYKNLVFFDYTSLIAGKALAYIFTLFYMLYFLIVEVNLNVRLVGILSSNFMPKTPYYLFLIISIGLAAFLASKGLDNICRLIEYTGIAFLLVTLLICVFMITAGDKSNVLPLFNPDDFRNIKVSVKEVLLPFVGIEILTVVPFNCQQKNISKKLAVLMLGIGLFYILIVTSTIKILGLNNTRLLNDAFFEAVKSTPAPIIERLDVIYITFGLASLFTGFGIMFAAIIEHASKVFKKVDRRWLIVATSVAVFGLSLFGIKTEDTEQSRNIIALLSVAAVFVIPLLLFITAKIKRRGCAGEECC